MARSQKTRKINLAQWVGLILFLVSAIMISTIIILTYSAGTAPDPRLYTPEEFSKKIIEIKKNPLPDDWGIADFVHHRGEKEKQKAAIEVVHNEMLSQIETLLNIPSAIPPETVMDDSKKYLIDLYGDLDNVPMDVYKIASVETYNTSYHLQQSYKGDPKKIEPAIFQIIREYYDLGKPPAHVTSSSIDLYLKKHKKINSN